MMTRLTILGLTLAFAACSTDEPGRLPRSEEPVDVVVSVAQRGPALETFPATVVSEQTAEIATRVSGTVDRVHVDVGDAVHAGDALVSLDGGDVEARVEAAEARMELAERSFRRVDNLAAKGAASAQERDRAKAELDAARAALTEARAQGAYVVVRAPFDGVVTSRGVDRGDLAAPGAPLMTLVAPRALKVVADLPAERFGTLKVGDPVLIELPDSDGPVRASITRTVPALGSSSRTFRIEIRLDAEAVPGSYARVRMERPGAGSSWIPMDAVVTRGQLRGVMAVEDGAVRLRWVRLGQTRQHAVELLAGPGDPLTVVRRPAPGLSDGTPVREQSVEDWTAPAGAVMPDPPTTSPTEDDR